MSNQLNRDMLLNIIREFGWEVEVIPYNGHEYARCTLPSCVDNNYSMTFLADEAIDVREGIDDEVYKLDVDEYVKRWKNAKNYYGMPGIPEVDEIEKEGKRIYNMLGEMLSDIDNVLDVPKKKIFNFLAH